MKKKRKMKVNFQSFEFFGIAKIAELIRSFSANQGQLEDGPV